MMPKRCNQEPPVKDTVVPMQRLYARPDAKVWNWLGVVLFYALSLVSLLVLIVNLVLLLKGPNSPEIELGTVRDDLAAAVACGFTSFVIVQSALNVFPVIKVVESGLVVRVFHFCFRWKFIPWDEIQGIVLAPRSSPDGLIWVVHVRQLTYWHRIVSMHYQTGWEPGIVLSPRLENRDELLDIIEAHIDNHLEDSQSSGARDGANE